MLASLSSWADVGAPAWSLCTLRSKARYNPFPLPRCRPIEACLQPTPQAEVQSGVGTKVLITLGPACQDEDVLVQMLEAGVTCARIDLTVRWQKLGCGLEQWQGRAAVLGLLVRGGRAAVAVAKFLRCSCP